MFEGSAGQILCLLETLHDPNKRPLQFGKPVPDTEPEMLDVYFELFTAGKEILSGGGGLSALTVPPTRVNFNGIPSLQAVLGEGSIVDLATDGSNLFFKF